MSFTISRSMMSRPYPILLKSKLLVIINKIENKEIPVEKLVGLLSKFRDYMCDNPFINEGCGVLEEDDIEEIKEDCFLAELLLGLEMKGGSITCLQKLISSIEKKYIGVLLLRKRLMGPGDVDELGTLDKLGNHEKFIISSLIMGKN